MKMVSGYLNFQRGSNIAEQNQQQLQWAKILAKSWADEDYKNRLLSDPASVMKEEGLNVPDDVEFKCVEATDKLVWMVLPPKPSDAGSIEAGEERLAAICYAF